MAVLGRSRPGPPPDQILDPPLRNMPLPHHLCYWLLPCMKTNSTSYFTELLLSTSFSQDVFTTVRPTVINIARIKLQNYCLCKVLLPISSRVVHKYILRDFGECCESVPLDCPGSYVSISIKIYITIILAHVVQVDAFLL